ncbi:MAG: ribbon-helix-helix protein, CopG family, partial [Desulfobacterales bacterium]
RLTIDIAEKLSQIAEETQKPKSYHIRKALELYLVELADLQIAYDRLHDNTDPVISSENLR